MKVTIERSAFLKSLNHVQSVVERRNTIPILSNVMMEAGNGRLKLTATDLDMEIVETLAADVIRNGAATAPAHMLYDIVRKLPDGAQVQAELLTSEGGRLAISAGSIRFELACLPKEDFPQMAAGALPFRFRLQTGELKKLIDKTRFAISTEETRFYLNGIYLHAHKDGKGKGEMRAVATDGHRLARFQIELPEGAADMPGAIVPRKTVSELRRLLDDTEGAIDISLSDTKIQFKTDGVELTSKLIDGTFPDYQRVIPSANDKVLSLDAREFAQAVDRVSTISADKTRAVKLSLANDRLMLSVINPDSGTATEELGASYSANAIEIGFNARYLLDITGQIEGKEVRFLLSDAGSPTLIEDSEDRGTLYVLMPMRV
ncbi:MAG TPA: DNA polymerase III subunit beta [Rhizomicrobium sp.]|jgi:DNA polymerase-3 subunit beta|nr:DNA polymerase III subunit beta [Rhizomicrobium sp.]